MVWEVMVIWNNDIGAIALFEMRKVLFLGNQQGEQK